MRSIEPKMQLRNDAAMVARPGSKAKYEFGRAL
jgi:hypothetical protein